jgi:hypothetical protein
MSCPCRDAAVVKEISGFPSDEFELITMHVVIQLLRQHERDAMSVSWEHDRVTSSRLVLGHRNLKRVVLETNELE